MSLGSHVVLYSEQELLRQNTFSKICNRIEIYKSTLKDASPVSLCERNQICINSSNHRTSSSSMDLSLTINFKL
jgi:hypothetical protein